MIDAAAQTISKVELPTKAGNPAEGYGLQIASGAIYDALQTKSFEYHGGLEGAALLCAEDGWPEDGEAPMEFAEVGPYPTVPGRCLLVGHDIETDTWSDAPWTEEELKALVKFHRANFRGMSFTKTKTGISMQPVLTPITNN